MPTTTHPARPMASIVIPAYNEAPIITGSLERVCEYLRTIEDRYRWEVVVVDDGSTDDTGALAEAFAARQPGVRVLHHPTNFQLGQALRYGFANCRGDYVVTMDSDLSYGPEHIALLLDAIQTTGARIVIASPYVKGGRTTAVPWRRLVVSKLANRFLSWMAKGCYATLTGMARAYDRRFLSTLNLKAVGVDINTEILYKAGILRARVIEIPAHLDWTSQRTGPPRRSSLRFTGTVLSYGFSGFLLRPLTFFLLPGLALLVLSGYTLMWAAVRVWEEFRVPGADLNFSQAVSRAFAAAPHTFVVGGIALMLAVQLLSLGLLSIQSKRYFEELFHLGTSTLRELRGVQHQPADDQGHGHQVVAGHGLAQHEVRQHEHEHLR